MIDSKSLGVSTQQIKKNQEILFGYIFLTPSSPGIVQSKIIVNALGSITNTTYKIEIPIIGNVLNDS